MKKRSDKVFLQHIDQAIREIFEFVADDIMLVYNSVIVKRAVCKNIEIIGEACSHISDSLKAKYSDIPWQRIKDMRNFLSHEYFDIDYDEIYNVVSEKLPDLHPKIIKILSEVEG